MGVEKGGNPIRRLQRMKTFHRRTGNGCNMKQCSLSQVIVIIEGKLEQDTSFVPHFGKGQVDCVAQTRSNWVEVGRGYKLARLTGEQFGNMSIKSLKRVHTWRLFPAK